METQSRFTTPLGCQVCTELAEGSRKGVCPEHHLTSVDPKIIEEMEKKRKEVLKRYVMTTVEPTVEEQKETINEQNYLAVQSMKEQLGAKSFDGVIEYLTKEMAFRMDPKRALETSRPLIVTGPPASGKTIYTKALIRELEKVFVVDVSGEYEALKLVHSGELFGDIWIKETGFRVIPNSNPILSKYEMEYIFGFLVSKMKEPNSPMRDFCFVIEDAIRFTDNQAIRSFIGESRKFVRKTIIVCQDVRAFEGMGEVVKP